MKNLSRWVTVRDSGLALLILLCPLAQAKDKKEKGTGEYGKYQGVIDGSSVTREVVNQGVNIIEVVEDGRVKAKAAEKMQELQGQGNMKFSDIQQKGKEVVKEGAKAYRNRGAVKSTAAGVNGGIAAWNFANIGKAKKENQIIEGSLNQLANCESLCPTNTQEPQCHVQLSPILQQPPEANKRAHESAKHFKNRQDRQTKQTETANTKINSAHLALVGSETTATCTNYRSISKKLERRMAQNNAAISRMSQLGMEAATSAIQFGFAAGKDMQAAKDLENYNVNLEQQQAKLENGSVTSNYTNPAFQGGGGGNTSSRLNGRKPVSSAATAGKKDDDSGLGNTPGAITNGQPTEDIKSGGGDAGSAESYSGTGSGGGSAGSLGGGGGEEAEGKPGTPGGYGGIGSSGAANVASGSGKSSKGGAGGSGSGVAAIDPNSLLGQFLPKEDEEGEGEEKGEPSSILDDAERGLASDDEAGLIPKEGDLFKSISRQYSRQAEKGSVLNVVRN